MLNAMVALSATVMTAWMLIDAIRRRADGYWYLIILTPLGEWIYFFAVKIHDYDLRRLRKALFERPASVAEMRARLEETPSDDNKVLLGKALCDAKQYEQAARLFDEVLDRDEHDKEALYGAALCQMNRNQLAGASEQLAALIAVDPTFNDYEPWFDLAYTHWQCGEKREAVALLEELVETSPRIKHKVILGKYLTRSGNAERGRFVLEEALDDFKHSTGFVKRTGGRWASQARDALAEAKRVKS